MFFFVGFIFFGYEFEKNVLDNGNVLICSDFGVRDNFFFLLRLVYLNVFLLSFLKEFF